MGETHTPAGHHDLHLDDGTRRDGARRGRPSSAYTGPETDPGELAVKLSELARTLQEEPTLELTLQAIVESAVQTVPGAQYAGLTVVRKRRAVATPAATDELVRLVDRAQYATGQGPCLDSVYTQQTVRLADMRKETRWPRFTRHANALGIVSMLSFQLYVQRDTLGALNLYSHRADAFTDESEQVGLLFAAHAAVAMAGAQQLANLSGAVAMRDVIGQAKGILMERFRLTSEQAFVLLVRVSKETNTKLADIARHLADTGELRTRER
ncbi:GAF and ANTAR domain-containing protein [Nonomuraea soli]|uniref:Transcriptional regulator with GAF, ATPase, and Fis domain n=1 Tax=Nonomuraea soli TaxID=1032476 RepID=A0A7W0HNV5_9ACTN|nr:GAF and ANTAR domain-containing protein [Nonomuraea soli]MBA2890183.1 transcriptional regulator with GAF, ATPase, and Fis domain [Nonomuraea soli]